MPCSFVDTCPHGPARLRRRNSSSGLVVSLRGVRRTVELAPARTRSCSCVRGSDGPARPHPGQCSAGSSVAWRSCTSPRSCSRCSAYPACPRSGCLASARGSAGPRYPLASIAPRRRSSTLAWARPAMLQRRRPPPPAWRPWGTSRQRRRRKCRSARHARRRASRPLRQAPCPVLRHRRQPGPSRSRPLRCRHLCPRRPPVPPRPRGRPRLRRRHPGHHRPALRRRRRVLSRHRPRRRLLRRPRAGEPEVHRITVRR